jgi:hypothetical protein
MRSLPIAARWLGQIHLGDGAAPTARAIRDEAAYDALIATLPTHRIQQRQPAPPSTDPLRARPPIAFDRDMLIVVTRGDTMDPPTLAAVIDAGDHVLVRYAATPPPPAARCYGIGGYAAAQVPRVDGPLVARAPPARSSTPPTCRPPWATWSRCAARSTPPAARPCSASTSTTAAPTAAWSRPPAGSSARTSARTSSTPQLAAQGQFAHRGAGTFYRLVAVDGGQLASPRPAY